MTEGVHWAYGQGIGNPYPYGPERSTTQKGTFHGEKCNGMGWKNDTGCILDIWVEQAGSMQGNNSKYTSGFREKTVKYVIESDLSEACIAGGLRIMYA